MRRSRLIPPSQSMVSPRTSSEKMIKTQNLILSTPYINCQTANRASNDVKCSQMTLSAVKFIHLRKKAASDRKGAAERSPIPNKDMLEFLINYIGGEANSPVDRNGKLRVDTTRKSGDEQARVQNFQKRRSETVDDLLVENR